MLSPGQVLPFLTHPQLDLRHHAAKYLADLGESAPVETAAEFWKAIDLYGDQPGEFGMKEQQYLFGSLGRVRQDQASLERLLQFLQLPVLDSESISSVSFMIARLPLQIVRDNQDRILPTVNQEHKSYLEQRLLLSTLSAEDLWERFIQHSEHAEKAETSNEIDHSGAELLVEALALHPEFCAPLAMAVMEDPKERWWLETWCTDLLGQMRHLPAMELFLQKLTVEDADFLRSSASNALARLPAGIVVPELDKSYESDDPYYRSMVAETLGKTMDPLGEGVLIRLLGSEKSGVALTSIACALCDLCTTDGIEPLRQLVINEQYDSTIADVKELMVTLSAMTNADFPERQTWTAEIKDPVYKQKLRNRFLSSFGMNEKTIKLFKQYLQDRPLDDLENDLSENQLLSTYEAPGPTMPYRREVPKIGRNDPCSCGSGKKYKKCCGK